MRGKVWKAKVLMSSLVYFVAHLRFPPEISRRLTSKISSYPISVVVSKILPHHENPPGRQRTNLNLFQVLT